MSNPKNTLMEINPFDIEPNIDNPRLLFDEPDLKYLQQSIKEVGVLVPLIVYRSPKAGKKTYVLLDGERRLICAKRLKLQKVPANEIDPPTKLQNILLMFNIHNVRKDWDLVPTALKLELVLRLLPKKERTATRVARITGMSAIRVAECKRLLSLPKRYVDMAMDPDSSKRIPGDFLAQMALALENISDYPDILKVYSKNQIIDIMIEKYREGFIKNFIYEFRTLRKILISPKKGVEKKLVAHSVREFLGSENVKDSSGHIVKKAMTMSELFEKTSYSVYKESEIIKKATELEESLSKFDVSKTRDVTQFTAALKKLATRIEKMLSKLR